MLIASYSTEGNFQLAEVELGHIGTDERVGKWLCQILL